MAAAAAVALATQLGFVGLFSSSASASSATTEDGDHAKVKNGVDADVNGDLHSNVNSIHHRTGVSCTAGSGGTTDDGDSAAEKDGVDADATGDLHSNVNSIHHRTVNCPTNSDGTPVVPADGGVNAVPLSSTSNNKSVQKAPKIVVPKWAAGGSVKSMNACKLASPGAKQLGSIQVGGTTVPLLSKAMHKSGGFTPHNAIGVASVSSSHRGIDAKTGTTFIAWHRTYGSGCNGKLNAILDKRVGDTFALTSSAGKATQFRITAVYTIAKGKFAQRWFRNSGPRQVVLMTCANLIKGKYVGNKVIVGVPLVTG